MRAGGASLSISPTLCARAAARVKSCVRISTSSLRADATDFSASTTSGYVAQALFIIVQRHVEGGFRRLQGARGSVALARWKISGRCSPAILPSPRPSRLWAKFALGAVQVSPWLRRIWLSRSETVEEQPGDFEQFRAVIVVVGVDVWSRRPRSCRGSSSPRARAEGDRRENTPRGPCGFPRGPSARRPGTTARSGRWESARSIRASNAGTSLARHALYFWHPRNPQGR